MNDQSGLPARKAALSMVSGVLRNKRPLDTQFEAMRGLDVRDAAFARALASGTLRHLGILEAVVRKYVPKTPPAHKAGFTSEILLLGACELLILETPPHAAVDAANMLASADNFSVHFKPLVNAVLHKIAREGEHVLAGLDLARLSLPDWLWSRWRKQYGEATTRRIAEAQQMPPPLDIMLRSEDSDFPDSTPLFGGVRRLQGVSRIDTLKGFRNGDWWVQDVAATLPVRLFGDVDGKRVVDLCAAPGGKTMQLAAAGAQVVAVDLEPERLQLLKDNLVRTRLQAQMIAGDAREVRMRAPMVLIDAPCTATGTIRRHPDLPWIKGADNVTQAAGAAYEILESGAEILSPEGILIFAVCSLEHEEGEDQIRAFLASHPDFSRIPVTPDEVFGHAEWITDKGDLRTLPCHLSEHGGMDGFYIARLRRNH